MINFITSFFKPTPKPAEVREPVQLLLPVTTIYDRQHRYAITTNEQFYEILVAIKLRSEAITGKYVPMCDADHMGRQFLLRAGVQPNYSQYVYIYDKVNGKFYAHRKVNGSEDPTDYLPYVFGLKE
ncbi:hypothetical protein G6M86_20885 [Agrobacterium tumefaciens]|uniref:Uncharacterized protein n=1 Tax=Agrobacterium tumefaciens TaxID=358 RepID=A0AAJ4N620_AGRTU|nr:hypothetical protein G6M86_20885 [Agrobacterium tumefaciens]